MKFNPISHYKQSSIQLSCFGNVGILHFLSFLRFEMRINYTENFVWGQFWIAHFKSLYSFILIYIFLLLVDSRSIKLFKFNLFFVDFVYTVFHNHRNLPQVRTVYLRNSFLLHLVDIQLNLLIVMLELISNWDYYYLIEEFLIVYILIY